MSQKARWLLAYLCVKPPQPQPRSRIAGLLWPDMPESKARRALNQAIWQVRRCLGPDALISRRDTLILGEHVWADVIAFRQNMETQELDALRKAVAFYKGDFLPGCYEDWALLERERLRDRYLQALERISQTLKLEGDYEQSLAYLREIIRLDPLREDAHRHAMQLYLVLDRPAAAMHQYEALRTLLVEELGVEPPADLRALRDMIERRLQQAGRTRPAPVFTANAHLPLIGRQRERGLLLHALEQVTHGQGTLMFVEGRQGIGKSRLLAEVRQGASWRGVQVGYGQAEETVAPYSPLQEAMANLLTSSCLATLQTRMPEPLLNTAAYLWPSLGTPPSDVRSHQLRQALVQLIIELARCLPLAIFLDDMHNADTAIFGVLDELLPHLDRLPIFIALAYRPLDARAREELWERLLALDRNIAPQHISLSPFNDEDQHSFIAMALNLPRDDQVIGKLAPLCGYTPLYIMEMLRYLRRRSMLTRTPDGEWRLEGEATALPLTVYALVQQRVQRLPAQARDLLAILAVIGERIPPQILHVVTAPYALDAPSLLYHLSRYGFLVREEEVYHFSHALVRDAVYESVPPKQRQAIHRQLAELWFQQDPVAWEAVAHHAQAGGQFPLAVHAHLHAAREAMRVHAYERVLYHCGKGSKMSPPKDVILCDLWLLQGEAYNMLGQRDKARCSLARALYLARHLKNPSRLAQACLKAGALSIRQSRYNQAKWFLRRALSLSEALGASREVVESFAYLADVEETVGDPKAALHYAQAAAQLASTNSWRKEQMHALSRWATASARQGELDDAAQRYEQVVQLAHEAGDLYVEGFALNGLGLLALTTREHRKAQGIFTQVMRVAEQLGDGHNQSVTRLNLAVAAANGGHLKTAMELGERALAEAQGVHNHRTEVLALLLLSDVFSSWGAFERAWDYLKEGEKLIAETQYTTGQGFAWCNRSIQHHRHGHVKEAIAWGEKCLSHFREVEMYQKLPMAAYCYALALLSEGHSDVAVHVLLEGISHTHTLHPRAILDAALSYALIEVGKEERACQYLRQALPVVKQMHMDEYLPHAWYHIALAAKKIEPSLAPEALRSAYVALQAQCLHVPEEHHASFLYDVIPNRRITQAWLQQAPRPIERLRIRLPARDGSRFISVVWTVDAGDDDVIVEATQGPVALRHHRLSRLLREAEHHGAKATHKALAEALRVSASTVRRDLRALDTR